MTEMGQQVMAADLQRHRFTCGGFTFQRGGETVRDATQTLQAATHHGGDTAAAQNQGGLLYHLSASIHHQQNKVCPPTGPKPPCYPFSQAGIISELTAETSNYAGTELWSCCSLLKQHGSELRRRSKKDSCHSGGRLFIPKVILLTLQHSKKNHFTSLSFFKRCVVEQNLVSFNSCIKNC